MDCTSALQESQSSSASPSSMLTIGYLALHAAHISISSPPVSVRPSRFSSYPPLLVSSSVAAASMAMPTCSPGVYPARSIAIISASSAASLEGRLGAKPPSSPCPVASPRSCRCVRSAAKISAPARSASPYVSNPYGTTMNSWKSVDCSACFPPFKMLSSGTGSVTAPSPPSDS